LNRPIRVATIIQQYHPYIGGAQSQVAMLAPMLQSLNVETFILTRRYAGLAAFEIINGIPVYRLPIPGIKPTASIGFTLAALRELHRLKPDVIHAHEFFSPATTAFIAKQVLGVPVAVTAHRSGELGDVERLKHKILGKQRLASLIKHADAFVAISHVINQELSAIGVPAFRRVLIPNAVDTIRFVQCCPDMKITQRALLGLEPGPTAIYTGRFAPEKRLDMLVEIWQAVRDQIPGAQLLLVGQGDDETKLRAIAGAGVVFVGTPQDVVPYLRAADLFVLPSFAEGLSVALLEAMAVELSVVATAIEGNLEVIQHGETGWLVPPNNAERLRNAVIQLFNNPTSRAMLGKQARAQVIKKFELSVAAKKLRTLYERLQNGLPAYA
jgi:glycosyltransferase involved in cell wall biosynthesis